MTDSAKDTRPGWLLSPLALGLWLGVAFGYLYVELISQPSPEAVERRRGFLNQILNREVKSDYLYATYVLANVQRLLVDHTPLTDSRCFALIDFTGVVFLFGCAGWFLRVSCADLPSRLGGLLWLGGTSPLLLYRHHFYHPSDFYGTGLMFFILLAAQRGQFVRLAVLCLVSGMLWEKTLFVPFLYLLWESSRADVGKAILPRCRRSPQRFHVSPSGGWCSRKPSASTRMRRGETSCTRCRWPPSNGWCGSGRLARCSATS